MRVLLTGGRGFIGRRAAHFLRAAGIEVRAPSHRELDVLCPLAKQEGTDIVVHLAARSIISQSWEEPAAFYRVNALGTLNVLELCRRTGARLININGYCYGRTEVLPTPESVPLQPTNPYAFSKVAAEQCCDFFRDTFGVAVTTLRVFNAYGPEQPDNFVIPQILRQALSEDAGSIVVNDGDIKRDFVHVDDVAKAILAIVTCTATGHVYNVGSGRSQSIFEIAQLIAGHCGVDKPVIDRAKRQPDSIVQTMADISAITRDTGWTPETTLFKGLADLVSAGKDTAPLRARD